MPTRRHAIADDLRNQILTGRLKPGERLPAGAQLRAVP
ncbi:GntR family transcriptional regulator [Streptomyces davaonensis]